MKLEWYTNCQGSKQDTLVHLPHILAGCRSENRRNWTTVPCYVWITFSDLNHKLLELIIEVYRMHNLLLWWRCNLQWQWDRSFSRGSTRGERESFLLYSAEEKWNRLDRATHPLYNTYSYRQDYKLQTIIDDDATESGWEMWSCCWVWLYRGSPSCLPFLHTLHRHRAQSCVELQQFSFK